MEPKPATTETERTEDVKRQCDQIIYRAARLMVEGNGASVPLMLDRLLSFAAAQATATDGKMRAAEAFREMACRIEAGATERKAMQ